MSGVQSRDTVKNTIKEMGKMESGTPLCAASGRSAAAVLLAAVAFVVVLIGAAPARANVADYALTGESGSVSTLEAGAHPDFVTKFNLSGTPAVSAYLGQTLPWARFRDVGFQLPPGLTGNSAGFPSCDPATFLEQIINGPGGTPPVLCPTDSQVGMVEPGLFPLFPAGFFYKTPLFNLTPPEESGIVARLGFIAAFYPIFIDVRLDPKREDALSVTVVNSPNIVPVSGTYTTAWAVPTDPIHDTERFSWLEAFTCFGQCGGPVASGLDPTPFMGNPTSCGPINIGLSSDSYQDPGEYFSINPMGTIEGCDQVPFAPSMSVQPSTRSASSSSGVDLSLQVPQAGWEDPEAHVTSDLKKAVVKLPQGVSINPSSADGLGSCTESQIGADWSERQIVAIRSGGAPVRLSFDGQSTPELPHLASADEVRTALEGLSSIGAGNVSVSGRNGGPWTVDFVGALAKTDVPQIEGTESELDRIIVRDPATFSLTYGGHATVPLPKNASASAIKAQLETLPNIGPGDVEATAEQGPDQFTEDPNYVIRIAFRGGLGGVDVPLSSTAGTLERLAKGGAPVQTYTVKQGGKLAFDNAEPTCPQSSKVGTGEIVTPVLSDPIEADLYIAKQGDNPFNSLLSGYLVAHGHGVMIKVAGKFDLDPETGQIVGTFDNNPQQPFSDVELHFKGGNRGVITTPKQCGTYTTEYELVPWSGNPPVTGTSEFTLDENCDPKPFAPGFDAGSSNPLAGGFTSFNVKVTRESGSPALSGIAVEPPQGLTGRLAGIPYCSNAALASISSAVGTGAAQLAAPSCPAASQVGTATAGAGSGSPFYVNTGKVYLAGPYKGAPISVAIVTPAVSGPFDLGNVVIRTPIYLDPVTAQIRAVSDPLPTILSGIPLDLRDVRVSLDRQGFTVNPTSCEPMAVNGQITGTGGAAANVSDRFQVGECAALGFKPKLALKLKGGTTRGKHPALTAILRPRAGDANISSISVAFPHAEFLDQSHIGTVCTRVQFAAESCPAASIYGKVSATSPLLEAPLTGNVYLRSSSHTLPDVVTDLHGPPNQPIHLEAAGRNDSIHGGLRNSFEFIPDAPISRVVLQLRGGKKGLLQNSTNICAHTFRAQVSFAAHNGRSLETEAPLQASCGGKGRHSAKANHHRHG